MDPVASRGEQDEVHEQRRHLRQRRPHQRAYSVHDGMKFRVRPALGESDELGLPVALSAASVLMDLHLACIDKT
jgi:hypothetical protein